MRIPKLPAVLHDRNFARYLGAVIVSHLGGGMATVAFAFAVLEFGTPTVSVLLVKSVRAIRMTAPEPVAAPVAASD